MGEEEVEYALGAIVNGVEIGKNPKTTFRRVICPFCKEIRWTAMGSIMNTPIEKGCGPCNRKNQKRTFVINHYAQ